MTTPGHAGELLQLPGAVVITGGTLAVVVRLCEAAQASRRRNGLPPAGRLADLAGACQRAMAAPGHTDVRERAGDEAGPIDVELTERVTTTQAAELLAKSERQLRRLAPRLGGRKVGGTWYLDLDAIAQHLEGTAA